MAHLNTPEEATDFTSIPPVVARVSPKIPAFWPDNIETWFAQLEAQFFLSAISDQRTKYSYVVANLDQRHAHEVLDILNKPLTDTPYDDLKSLLISRLSVSNERRIKQVLLEEELGSRSPSQFLRHLQNLSSSAIGDQLLKTLWLQRLPTHIQAILQAQIDLPCDRLAIIADKIMEVQPNFLNTLIPDVNAVSTPPVETLLQNLIKQMENLTFQVNKLASIVMVSSSQRAPRRTTSRASTPDSNRCWYHRKFGSNAHKCISPCDFPAENELDSR